MERLIDARALMDKLPEMWNKYPHRDLKIVTGVTIASMPTIDPFKHGYWMPVNDEPGLTDTDTFKCYVCKEEIKMPYFSKYGCDYDFCPRCGSVMDDDTDNS